MAAKWAVEMAAKRAAQRAVLMAATSADALVAKKGAWEST